MNTPAKYKTAGRIALATTSTARCLDIYKYQNTSTKQLDFENTFELMLSGTDVVNHKPNPEIYLKIIEEMDINKEDAIVFEDSLIGVEAACKAGLDVIHVYDEISEVDIDKIRKLTPYSIRNFSEITKN